MLANLGQALSTVFELQTMLAVLLASLFGLVLGSIPGMSATLGVSLLIPFTFFMDAVPAIAAIISMVAMAIFAGDIPSALLRMPGTPASAAYVDEAFLMTRRGQGALALGIGMVGSALGGLFGAFVLIGLAPALGRFAMKFSSTEYFWVAALGLTAAVVISSGSQIKGAISLFFGLALSIVGMDPSFGQLRFTFGATSLSGGISFIPVMIGLFGLSEVLRNVTTPHAKIKEIPRVATKGYVKDSFKAIWRFKGKFMQGNVIGAIIGVLPGAGADIAAWISYAVAKVTSKEPRRYGTGYEEPLVAAGTANNASLAAEFVPTLAFGIPGDSVTAILVGVLIMKGVTPGPMLFTQQASTLYAIYILFIIANLLMLPLGFLYIKGATNILKLPRAVLMAIVVAVAIVGAFALNSGKLEILMVLIFGLMGVLFERNGIPVAPAVLGLVLGSMVEQKFMMTVIKTNWNLGEFVTRPISAVLAVLVVLMLFYPVFQRWLEKRNPDLKGMLDDQ